MFLFLQVLQELQDICPQRCWERTRTESQWTYGHVVSSPDFTIFLYLFIFINIHLEKLQLDIIFLE